MLSLADEENAVNPVLLQLILDVAFPRVSMGAASSSMGCVCVSVCLLPYKHPLLCICQWLCYGQCEKRDFLETVGFKKVSKELSQC